MSGHERNCCFLNTHDDRFATISAASGLDFADDGRSLGLTDWDHDGDLDVWIANRTGPRLRLMRNETPDAGRSITVSLVGTTCNRDAIGARLELKLTAGDPNSNRSLAPLLRTVRAGSGFMSQASKRIHFGIGTSTPQQLTVKWPDGTAQSFNQLEPGTHYEIVQGEPHRARWRRPHPAKALHPSKWDGATASGQARIVITAPLPVPNVPAKPLRDDPHAAREAMTLVNLWSPTCLPCLDELQQFSERAAEIRAAGINVKAWTVDESADGQSPALSRSREILDQLQFPFAAAAIDPEHAGMLDLFHQAFLSLRRPLPLPSSFLLNPDGRVAVIYRGPVAIDQVLRDAQRTVDDPALVRDQAVPFPGRWLTTPLNPNAKRHALAFLRAGFLDRGAEYLEHYLQAHLQQRGWGPRPSWPTGKRLAELCDTLADFYRLRNEPEKVVGIYRVALSFDAEFIPSLINLGKIFIDQGNSAQGIPLLERAHRLAPDDALIASDLAIGHAISGNVDQAETVFLRLIQQHPQAIMPRLNLSKLYQQSRRYRDARALLEQCLQIDPASTAALSQLGWILAAAPSESERDLARAQLIAERLLQTGPQVSAYDLLGAVHASRGEFSQAIAQAETALEHNKRAMNDAALTQLIQDRLQRYRAGRPFQLP